MTSPVPAALFADPAPAPRRAEEHALPLESARTQVAYGWPSAVNRLLILNAEPYPGRSTAAHDPGQALELWTGRYAGGAIGKLCIPPLGTSDHSRANRMIALLVDGLRYGAPAGLLPQLPMKLMTCLMRV